MDFFPGEIRMLERIKKIQGGGNGYVYIDTASFTGVYCRELSQAEVDRAWAAQVKSSWIGIRDEDHLIGLLKHATEARYLEKPASANVYQITFAGRNAFAVRRHERNTMLLNGVVFPAVVALFTTLLTIWANGGFG